MSTFMAKAETIERKWYVLDAQGKPLGKVAAAAASILRGKHRPEFTPHVDCGEFVIVINADTNDAYAKYSAEIYRSALEDFVSYVRGVNGDDAHIILVCNMMKTEYSATIGEMVEDLGGAENRYYYFSIS